MPQVRRQKRVELTMADLDQHDNPDRPSSRWKNENPSSKPLKLALLAAAIICVIAIIVYLKARHHPPALHDILQHPPANRSEPGSLRAAVNRLVSFPSA